METAERMVPDASDVARYESLGWWTSPVLFSETEVDGLRAAVVRAYAGEFDQVDDWPLGPPLNGDDPEAVKTLLWAWRISHAIRSVVFDPRITRIASALLRVDRIRVWQDQAIWKPGLGANNRTEAGNIGWHQDFAYWQNSSTTRMISANLALQDTTVVNGALQVFDGSHRLGLISASDGFFDTNFTAQERRFAEVCGGIEPTVLNLRAGQVSFHHALTVHGSGPNHGDAPRLVIAPAYLPDGARYVPATIADSPHAKFLGTARASGMPWDGPYFPLVPC